MAENNHKIKEELKDLFDRSPKSFKKRTTIIFDGRQYNIRIPVEFVKKAQIDPEKDEFEFTLETPEDKLMLPKLKGEVVEKG